jgi:DNA polymerase-3 subunit gamma/tau
VQLFYQIALIGRRDLALAPDARIGFEMALLRMLAFKPAGSGSFNAAPSTSNAATTTASNNPAEQARAAIKTSQQPTGVTGSGAVRNRATAKPAATPSLDTTATAQSAPAEHNAQRTTPVASSTQTINKTEQPAIAEPESLTPDHPPATAPKTTNPTSDAALQWHQLVEQLKVAGITQQLALNCTLKQQTSDAVILQLAEPRRQLLNPSRQTALQKALQDSLGSEVKLTIEVVAATQNTPADIKAQHAAEKQQDAEQSIYNDQTVKTLINTFDAQVAPGSIAPID